jgi:MFS family permease
LVLGRLSNHLGRRLTAIASLLLLLLGCLLLLNVHDIGTLLVGAGTGLASSGLTSYIVDAAPSRPEWLASVASSQGPMLGLTVGAIASGALVQFGPWPRDLIYLVCVGFLFLSAALIAISPETATPTPGAWRSLLPRVRVPARVRHLLPVAAAVFLATWATGAFYQAFVPALVGDQLHTRSPLILGLVFAAYMTPSVLGAPIGGRFTSAVAQRVGMITFLAGMIGIITAIAADTLVLFIIATIVLGRRPGHRDQRRHPWAAARQHSSRPGTDIQRDLPPLLQRRHLPQSHLWPTFQDLLATADRPRIRGTALVATLFTVLGARDPPSSPASSPIAPEPRLASTARSRAPGRSSPSPCAAASCRRAVLSCSQDSTWRWLSPRSPAFSPARGVHY